MSKAGKEVLEEAVSKFEAITGQISKARKGILGEAVNKLETLAGQMEEMNTGLWTIALELDKLNEQLEEFFKYAKEKGLTWRAK